jgi:hypothetical protein
MIFRSHYVLFQTILIAFIYYFVTPTVEKAAKKCKNAFPKQIVFCITKVQENIKTFGQNWLTLMLCLYSTTIEYAPKYVVHVLASSYKECFFLLCQDFSPTQCKGSHCWQITQKPSYQSSSCTVNPFLHCSRARMCWNMKRSGLGAKMAGITLDIRLAHFRC